MIVGGQVSDHAFLRWLERAKELDIEALQDEFSALCLPIVESGASGGWIEGETKDGSEYKVWIAVRSGVVTTAMQNRPMKYRKVLHTKHEHHSGKNKVRDARRDYYNKERMDNGD